MTLVSARLLLISIVLVSATARAEFVGIDFGPGTSPLNWNSITGPGFYAGLRDDSGTPTSMALTVAVAGSPFGVTPTASTVPQYAGGLSQIDGNQYQFGGTFKAAISGLVPGEEYNFYLFGLRSGASMRQQVMVKGATTLTFTQQAEDGELAINDQTGSASRTLASYAKTVTASATGGLEVTVVGGGAAGRPFVIAGMALDHGPRGGSAAPIVAASSAAPVSSGVAVPVTASAAPAPVSRSAPGGPDVVGVYLGMPLAEAQAVVREGDSRLDLKPFEGDVGTIWGSRIRGIKYPAGFQGGYVSQEANEKIAVAGYPPPRDGEVAAVGRTSYLGNMLYSDLRESLIEKYGPVLFEAGPGEMRGVPQYALSWSRGRDGTPLTDPDAVKACSRHGNNDAEDLAPAMTNLSDTAVQFNGQYDRCAFTLVVYAMPHDLPSIVRFYNIVLYDLDEIRKRNQETIAMTEVEAQKIEAAREKAAAGKKPRL